MKTYFGLNLQEVLFFVVRIAILLATLLWGLSHPEELRDLRAFQVTFAFFAVYSLGLFALLFQYRKHFKNIFLAASALDIAIVTVFQSETGGLSSPFFLGYYLSAIMIAVYYGARVGAATAATILVFVATVNYAQIKETIDAGSMEEVLIVFGFISTLAIIGGILNVILQQEKDEVEELQKVTFDQLERLETLYQVSGAMTHWADFEGLLRELVNQASRAMKADQCSVFLKDSAGELRVALDNVPRDTLGLMEKLSVQAIESGIPIEVALTSDSEGGSPLAGGSTAFLVAPMTSGNRIQGCVAVSRAEGAFSKEERDLLSAIASGAAASIESAHLHSRAQRHLNELKSMINVVSATNQGEELDKVFEIALGHLRELFRCEYGVIHLYDPEFGLLSPQKSFGYHLDELDSLTFEKGECPALTTEDPLISNDMRKAAACPHVAIHKTGSFACVGLKANGSLLGSLFIASKDKDVFNLEDKDFIKSIGEQLAMAIHRSNLFSSISTMAITDSLTGLWNFGEFQRRIKEEVQRSTRYHHGFILLMIDIDYFKNYNDRWGHPRGDEVLKRISKLLRQCVRETDSVCRYGGEEFCVIIPETDQKQGFLMAERMRQVVSEYGFPGEDEQPNGDVTISIGLASFPEHASSPESLISRADEALYKAKHLGRNQTVCCQENAARKITEEQV